MANKKIKESDTLLPTSPPIEETKLVCKWWKQKKNVDNGLQVSTLLGTDSIGSIKFELKGKPSKEKGYSNLLSAKIFETFGVYNPSIAAAAFSECINCIIPGSSLMDMEPNEARSCLETHFENTLSLFQEMRPRDSMELMMVKKIIILDYLSNREFIASTAASSDETRTIRQARGIKLSRLLIEFKDKFTKYRKPQQQIHVQYNHIHNEGQAIVGSQLSTEGG